ncbi:MAG: 50S ribosomal protein L15 [Chloroflexi bacterium]|nr:50S ribosomal protein L15 [Chloroflexota bacterium]
MVRQNELKPAPGSKFKRKRVGRGNGSGHGTYSGKGQKGQKARAGGGVRPGFEGGQLPLIKRLPSKRGFKNIFKKEYSLVDVGSLNAFGAGTDVTPETLVEAGLIKSVRKPVKILGDGKLEHSLVVKAHAYSASARSQIESLGGKAEVISG